MTSGDSFEVRLQFPAVVGAAPPSWQTAADERRQEQEEQEEHNALFNLFFLGFGLLAGVGGAIGIYGLWYTKGRDPHTGMVADFIPAPPDDLPPGAAGTLLDETADQEDIVATLVNLGHRGVLKIDDVEGESILGFGGGRDFLLTLVQPDAPLAGFEKELISALFGSPTAGESVKLSEVKTKFDKSQKEIKDKLYEELVKRGYFLASPEETRKNWGRIGVFTLIGAFVFRYVLSRVADGAVLYWLPVIVFAALGVALLALAKAMPKKTQAGAEAAAKWRAFRRYLDDIEKYEHLEEAKGIFDKYLPFAVAFGLESSWVNKFASVNAPAPEWYGTPVPTGGGNPYGRRRRGGPVIVVPGGGFGGYSGSGGGGGGPDFDPPDFQDMSDSASGGLQGMSDSLSDMFNVAGKIFSGMSSGGGRGGFGGGSFGGGGGRGGGGGGGSRGFG